MKSDTNPPEEDQPSSSEGEPDRHDPRFKDHTYRVGKLAVEILRTMVGKEGTRNIPGLPKRSALDYFSSLEIESARLAAEKLLDDIEIRRGDVDAYQLFEEGKEYSVEAMAGVLKDANWGCLRSKQPVSNLMETLREKFEGAIHGESTIPPARGIAHGDVIDAFNEFFTRIEEHSSEFPELRNALLTVFDNVRLYQGSTQEEALAEQMWLAQFIDWCFPKPSEEGHHHFRAHEIFRYAAANRWEQDRLHKPLASLSANCFPEPKIPAANLKKFQVFNEATPEAG